MQKVYLTPDKYYEFDGRNSPWRDVETDYPPEDGAYLASGTVRGKPVFEVVEFSRDFGWNFEEQLDVIDAWMPIPKREEDK